MPYLKGNRVGSGAIGLIACQISPGMAVVQAAQGLFPAALRTLQSARTTAADQEDVFGEAYALHALGKALWANGQYEPAQLAFAAAHQKYTTVGLVAEAHRLAVDMAALGARPVPSERGNQAI